jgi:hypothetical protein
MSNFDHLVWLVFLMGAILLAAVNTPRRSRYRQWWGPIVALLLALVTIVASREAASWRPWEALLSPWAGAPWIAELEQRLAPVSTWLLGIAALVNRFLNLGVLFLAVALKFGGLLVFRVMSDDVAARVSIAYRGGDDGRELRPAWVFGRWFFAGMATLALVFGLLHAAGVVGPIEGQVTIAWPALVFVLFHEIARYLLGPFPTAPALRREPTKQHDVAVPTARASIAELVDEYVRLWQPWLIGRGSYEWQPGETVASARDPACDEFGLWGLGPDECRLLRGMYVGRDTLIVDSLPYRVEEVLRIHIGDSISRGWRVLALVDEESQVKGAVRWLARVLAPRTSIPDQSGGQSEQGKTANSATGVLRSAVVLDERGAQTEAPDVLVLTLRQELSAAVRDHWERRRTILLVLDAQATALWHGAEVAALRLTLASLSGRVPQMVALADWRIDLEAAARNVMLANVEDVKASPPVELTHYLVWRAEAPNVPDAPRRLKFQDRIFTEINELLTPETSLVYPALLREIIPVQIVEQKRTPWRTARSNAADSLRQLEARYKPVGYIDDHRVRIAPADWEVVPANGLGAVVMVRDTHHNLPWAARKWMSLSDEGTLAHIVAPAYLYRDYFAAALPRFIEERRRFSPLAPLNLSAAWSTAYELFRGLERGPVDLDLIAARLDALTSMGPKHADDGGVAPADTDGNGADRSTSEALEIHGRVRALFGEQLFDRTFHASALNFEYQLNHEFDPGELRFVPRVRLRLSGSAAAIRPSWLRVIELRAKDVNEAGRQRVLNTVYQGQLYQRFLPGQTHGFDGEVYALTSFNVEHGYVDCEARFTAAFEDHYRQRRHYRVHWGTRGSGAVELEDEWHHERVRLVLTRYDVEIDVRTVGYLAFQSTMGLDLQNARPVGNVDAATDIESSVDLVPPRRFRHGKLLHARFELPDVLAGSDFDVAKAAYTLCLLLNEAFFSYYPEVVPYLVATTATRPAADAKQSLLTRRLLALVPTLEVLGADDPAGDRPFFDIHFIEDSAFDLGTRSSLVEHLRSIFETLAGYLAWSDETVGKPGHFLHFGGDAVPEELDLVGACRVLEAILAVPASAFRTDAEPPPAPADPEIESGGFIDGLGDACDFCGRTLASDVLQRLDDGRSRCAECDAQAVDHIRVLRRLYRDARSHFEGRYGLKIAGQVNVRFADANEIAAARGSSFTPTSSFDARAIGLAVREGNGRLSIYVENGQPQHSVQAVIIHELTHIWQFANLPETVLQDTDWIEGHAVWVEVTYLRHLRYLHVDAYHERWLSREDEYGRGYRRILDEMEQRGMETPFDLVFWRGG